jgi:hypothetical protein
MGFTVCVWVKKYDFKYAYSVTKPVRLCTIAISSNGVKTMDSYTAYLNYLFMIADGTELTTAQKMEYIKLTVRYGHP